MPSRGNFCPSSLPAEPGAPPVPAKRFSNPIPRDPHIKLPRFTLAKPSVWDLLVLLAIALPNLVYLAISSNFPASWRVVLLTFDLALVAMPFFLLPGRVKIWLAIPLVALSPLEVMQILLMRVPSTLGVLGSLMDTNFREASEFILGTLPWSFIVIACSCVFVWCAIRALRSAPARLGFRSSLAVTGCIGCAFALYAVHLGRETKDWESAADLAEVEFLRTYPFGFLKKIQELGSERMRLHHRAERIRDFDWRFKGASAPDSSALTIVVILGESSRRESWGLYGYARQTSPRLASDTDLFVFRNAISNSNSTREAITQILALAQPSAPGLFDTTPSVLQGFRKSGFRTWWLSNQAGYGLTSAKPAMVGREADFHLFIGADPANQVLYNFDESLVSHLMNALADPSPRKLIILHTMGSHFDYAKRYPSGFAKFPISPDGGTDDIGAYDNSVLYTDWLLAAIRDTLKTRRNQTAMVFVSDHGEALGEDCGHGKSYIHGSEFPCAVEYEIPFLMWLSPEFQAAKPPVPQHLRENLSKRVSSTDLPATLLGIAGIESGRLSQDHNLAGSSFAEHPRDLITPSGKIIALDDSNTGGH